MPDPASDFCLEPDDWRRIRDALRYLGRDLHHRSYAVHGSRRELLWQEMDQVLALADRLEQQQLLPREADGLSLGGTHRAGDQHGEHHDGQQNLEGHHQLGPP